MVKPKLSSTIHPAPTTAPECAGPACHRSLLPLGVGAQVVERRVFVFPGYEWDIPVLSFFRDWDLGWVLKSGI